jgi:hypothetical protein
MYTDDLTYAHQLAVQYRVLFFYSIDYYQNNDCDVILSCVIVFFTEL